LDGAAVLDELARVYADSIASVRVSGRVSEGILSLSGFSLSFEKVIDKLQSQQSHGMARSATHLK
jgi:hypothetical protein